MLKLLSFLAAACLLGHHAAQGASLRSLLAASGPPVSDAEGTSIINSILGKKVAVMSFGEKSQALNPGPTVVGPAGSQNGLSPQPTSAASGPLTILFQCRAVGQQIYTTDAQTGQFTQTGAEADLWCGPGAAKIAIRHFFSNLTTGNEAFEGGSPVFQAVDGSGIVVGSKLISGGPLPSRFGDGGFGSVGDVLLNTTGRGTFSDVTFIIRNNELGGMLPSGLSPLTLSGPSVQNFAPTGAEGVPNAPLFVPYQADYTFITGGARPAWPQPGTITQANVATSTSASG